MRQWLGTVDLHNGRFSRRFEVRVEGTTARTAAARAVDSAKDRRRELSPKREPVTEITLHLIRVQ